MDIITEQDDMFIGGVVHSFDGTIDEIDQVLAVKKLSIGINVSYFSAQSHMLFFHLDILFSGMQSQD